MANEQNLVRGDEAHKLTAEEASKGGKASGKARRAKRDLKIALEMILESEIKSKSGETMTTTEAMCRALMKKALKGDVRAFETIRDTIGQKPIDRVQYAEVDQKVIEDVEAAVLGED